MNCALCGGNKKSRVRMLGFNICSPCMEGISSTSVAAEEYDYYKDIIKIALQNYINERVEVDPVK